MAPPRRVRALNARTRVRERARVRGSLERGGGEPSSEAEPAQGAVKPRARRSPLEGGVKPRARQSPLEGGVKPRARQNLLEGAFEWATPVGCGDHRSVGHAPCARLGGMCFDLGFCRF
jgi:hypothetical protein